MNTKISLILLFSLAFSVLNAQKALTLKKYFVQYTVKNAGINSTGRFDNISANVVLDDSQLDKSSIYATIQTASFNSSIALRDKHLKDKEYLDAVNYPTITLASTKITKKENGYLGTFNLTIKGITKSVQLPFYVTVKGNDLEFVSSDLSIDRTAYGVGGSSFTLSNTVKIKITATFSK